jgi:hypothetical protein
MQKDDQKEETSVTEHVQNHIETFINNKEKDNSQNLCETTYVQSKGRKANSVDVKHFPTDHAKESKKYILI